MEIRLEDLFIKCERCNGSGTISETHAAGSHFGVSGTANQGACPDCDGQGGKLTPSGEAICDFLRKLRRESGM
jgi:DnaJ-class molecular chaperone